VAGLTDLEFVMSGAAGAGVGAAAGSAATGGGGAAAGGNGAVGCGDDPTPPQGGCPDACTLCDPDGVCTIDCSQSPCGPTIVCPEGLRCRVLCASQDICRDKIVSCPQIYRCEVFCSAMANACNKLTVQCTTGVCSLSCTQKGDVCNLATVDCGTNACLCTAGSAVVDKPTVDCNQSCMCKPCTD
jgi:hypothetical protein